MQCKFNFFNKEKILLILFKICLETARDAVLSLCGHLFCWPCIHQWLETRAHNPTCPVCKSSISREKLVPIYGRNSPQTDPRYTLTLKNFYFIEIFNF